MLGSGVDVVLQQVLTVTGGVYVVAAGALHLVLRVEQVFIDGAAEAGGCRRRVMQCPVGGGQRAVIGEGNGVRARQVAGFEDGLRIRDEGEDRVAAVVATQAQLAGPGGLTDVGRVKAGAGVQVECR